MELLQIQDDRVKDLFNEYISITRYTEDTLSSSYVYPNQIETAKEIIK